MAHTRTISKSSTSLTPAFRDGDVPSDSISVGAHLRAMRASRALTLRALAELSGLNVNTLSLIENDRTSPSVSTLQRLSQCLQVPLTDFFRAGGGQTQVVFQKSGARVGAPIEAGSMQDLAAGMQHPGAEPLLLTLVSGADSGRTPIVHTGREFVYCLDGRVKYGVGVSEYILDVGDSLCFEAYLPHRWKNDAGQPARVLIVLCPMDARDDPRDRHFSACDPTCSLKGGVR